MEITQWKIKTNIKQKTITNIKKTENNEWENKEWEIKTNIKKQ